MSCQGAAAVCPAALTTATPSSHRQTVTQKTRSQAATQVSRRIVPLLSSRVSRRGNKASAALCCCSARVWGKTNTTPSPQPPRRPAISPPSTGTNTHHTHLPMCQLRNRNCRLRLLFSMTSSSVTVTSPASPQAMPIIAKFFRNSHPSAPAPTRNSFRDCSFCCRLRPMTAIWGSYLHAVTQRDAAAAGARGSSSRGATLGAGRRQQRIPTPNLQCAFCRSTHPAHPALTSLTTVLPAAQQDPNTRHPTPSPLPAHLLPVASYSSGASSSWGIDSTLSK